VEIVKRRISNDQQKSKTLGRPQNFSLAPDHAPARSD
jgi:hypothetical protein